MRAIILATLLFASNAQAATAVWTGKAEAVQTVTFQSGWRCEYQYFGRYFWFVFTSFCPSTVEIR